jgi:hypothetical protein
LHLILPLLLAKGPLSLARHQFEHQVIRQMLGLVVVGFQPGPTDISTVDRIIFASDTATAVTKGPLSLARRNLAASGNLTDAWFGGGSYNRRRINSRSYYLCI